MVGCAWLGSCGAPERASAPELRFDDDPASRDFGTVVATGLAPGELAGWQRRGHAEWVQRFPVTTAAALDVPERPPVAGEYFVADGAVRFVPDYAPLPGTTWVARWVGRDGAIRAEARFTPELPPLSPTTAVRAVYPSAEVVPENLLKLYVAFTAPMSRGEAAHRLHLFDDRGAALPLPWVAPEHELWNAGTDRLTLFFDPGRIKQGVGPNEDLGPPLVAGRVYRLVIDAAWPDAGGQPLVGSFEKSYRVTAPDRTPPDPATWRLVAPQDEGDPLRVEFPEPLDRALVERLLSVIDAAGRSVEGTVEVASAETTWRFTPGAPWRAGPHALVVDTALEDLAGNSPRRRFDAPLDAQRGEAGTLRLPFDVP